MSSDAISTTASWPSTILGSREKPPAPRIQTRAFGSSCASTRYGRRARQSNVFVGLCAKIVLGRRRRNDLRNQDRSRGGQVLESTARNVNHDVGIAYRRRSDIHPEIGRQDRPSVAVEALLQGCSEPAHEDCVTARAPGHHHDAVPGELITSLVRLHPREELGLIHAQIKLDIHCGLARPVN